MDRISFDIFIPDPKKFHWTPNTIVFGLWFTAIALLWLLKSYIPPGSTLQVIILICVLAVTFYYLITSFFKYQPLRGVLEGRIIFNDDAIIVDDKTYDLKAISSLDFRFIDYYGEMRSISGANFDALLSQGIHNFVEFKDASAQNVKVYFRIQGKHGSMTLYPFINQAVKVGAMSYYRAIDLINVENVTKPT